MPSNGARISVFAICACVSSMSASCTLSSSSAVSYSSADDALFEQFGDALLAPHGELPRTSPQQARLQVGVVELDEQLTVAHPRAFGEVDRDDLAGDLGLQLHALGREQRAARRNVSANVPGCTTQLRRASARRDSRAAPAPAGLRVRLRGSSPNSRAARARHHLGRGQYAHDAHQQ